MTLILVRSVANLLARRHQDITVRGSLCLCIVIFIPVMCNQCVSTQLGVQETFQPIICANMSFYLKLSVIRIDLCIITKSTVLPLHCMAEQIRLEIVCDCVLHEYDWHNRHTHLPTGRQTGGQAVHMLLLIGIYSILPVSRSNLWAVSVQPSVYVCAFALS